MDGRHGRARATFVASIVVLGVVVGVSALPAAAVEGPEVSGNDTASATFNQSTVTEDRGDVAAIGINLTDTATVTVGSETVNYRTNVTVNDTDDDGRVTLLMNTYLAGTRGNETNVYGTVNDTVLRTNRTTGPLDAPLEASSYNLSVAVGGRETDTATLELAEPTTGDLVTWTAPAASFGNITNASEVAAAVNAGRITTTDTVATGDVLVNQFKLSGIYGALAVTNVSTLVERGVLDLSMVQTNPETNRPPKRLDVNRSLANDAIRVIPDARNDVLYVNVDTGAAAFDNGTPAAGDEFETTLSLAGTSELARNNRSASANVTLVGAELSLGTVSLSAAPNQTVAGTTSVAPGSEVTVRLQRNGTGSFATQNTTRVKPNGSFAATFNLSTVAPESTVSVRADGPLNTTDRTTATVRRNRSTDSAAATASLAFANQTSAGRTITVENATLSEGGFVVITAASRSANGSVLGVSSYLENGTNRNVTVALDRPLVGDSRVRAVVHTDSNDNRVYDFATSNGTVDRPYTADGDPVAATAELTVRNATTTSATSTTSATATTAGPDGTAATRTDDTTSNGSGPGFGIVSVLVAVAGLAGLAARRGR